MPKSKATKDEIVQFALTAFLEHGIQAITLKQLALELGVSTKTLYKLFIDKSDLLRGCLELHYSRFFDELLVLGAKGRNEVEAFVLILDKVVSVEFKVNPKFYAELNKYYPELQTEIGTANNSLPGVLGDVIENGKYKGLFLPDIDADVCLRTLQRLYQGITRDLCYAGSGLSGPELVKKTVFLYLRGMCTVNGIQKLEQALRNSAMNGFETQKIATKNEKST